MIWALAFALLATAAFGNDSMGPVDSGFVCAIAANLLIGMAVATDLICKAIKDRR